MEHLCEFPDKAGYVVLLLFVFGDHKLVIMVQTSVIQSNNQSYYLEQKIDEAATTMRDKEMSAEEGRLIPVQGFNIF